MIYDFLISWECLLILILTALSCAIIGDFLLLMRLSMLSDALSHTVLLGIVLAFFFAGDLNSPLLLIGAVIFSLITVFLIKSISDTGLVGRDDSVGVVFPMFFSMAVLLISLFARNSRLSTHTVLLGEIVFAPLDRIAIFGISMPVSAFVMLIVLIIEIIFSYIFYKELKIGCFDPCFASVAGFSSALLFYGLMTLSSLCFVSAFNAVGAILVISFAIAPAASAYMLARSLYSMIYISFIYAIINSVLGYLISIGLNVSMSGSCAVISTLTFTGTYIIKIFFNKTEIAIDKI